MSDLLPSWRPGRTRDSLVSFLNAADSLPVSERVAAFDNDGTLWCERPSYVQLDFMIDALKQAVVADETLAERAEYAALLTGDHTAMSEIGLDRIALALAELFSGLVPEEFDRRAREFMQRASHGTLDVPVGQTVYQPMLELLDELRRREFTIFIVTGGGTEFVRSVSADLYGVDPEAVVGTLIAYEFTRDADGVPRIVRTGSLLGDANEGEAKVANMQTQLGRRPILAAGNSGGDREMLEWAAASAGPSLAIIVDHDDADREFSYVSVAQSFSEPEPIIDVANRLGWTIVSMADDWTTIFPFE